MSIKNLLENMIPSLRNNRIVEMIDRWKSDKQQDLFIHFTNDFEDSKGQKLNQIGIKTSFNGANPIGIYGYPLNDIPDKNLHDYFDSAYIFSVDPQGFRWVELSTIDDVEVNRILGIIKNELYINNKSLEGFSRSPEFLYDKLINKVKKDHDDYRSGRFIFDVVSRAIHDTCTGVWSTKAAHFWYKTLGYAGLKDVNGDTDLSWAGQEPQIVVFSSKFIKVVDSTRRVYSDTKKSLR